jgi:hypothetical protein
VKHHDALRSAATAIAAAAAAAALFQVDWESMWREQLSEYSRSAAGIGWTTKITMEVRVNNSFHMLGCISLC